jgi:hypothetical protein
MTKDDNRSIAKEKGEAPKRSLKEMLRRLQALPKPDKIEERDTEKSPERTGL